MIRSHRSLFGVGLLMCCLLLFCGCNTTSSPTPTPTLDTTTGEVDGFITLDGRRYVSGYIVKLIKYDSYIGDLILSKKIPCAIGDQSGNFRVRKVPPGKYVLVSFVGTTDCGQLEPELATLSLQLMDVMEVQAGKVLELGEVEVK